MQEKPHDALPSDVRDAVSYIRTGKPLPSRITRYAGKIRVEVIENGKTTWSLKKVMMELPEKEFDKCTSCSDMIRYVMKYLGQGDEGFAQLVGIPVATIRAWKQGGREPRGPGRRLLEVSVRYPEIMWDVVRESEEAYT